MIWILYGTHIRYVHCPSIKMVLFKIVRRKDWDLSCLCFENHLWSAGCMKPFDPAGSRPKPVQINSLLSLSYFSSHRKNIGREFDFWSPSMSIDYILKKSPQKFEAKTQRHFVPGRPILWGCQNSWRSLKTWHHQVLSSSQTGVGWKATSVPFGF